MISRDKLANATSIITHDSCADGTVSAILLKDAFRMLGKSGVPITFLQYGTDAYKNLKAVEGMLFCDFTPPADRAQEFVDAGAIVLDHHKKAEALVKSFGENGIFADEVTEPGVSGAVMAYEHVWKPLAITTDDNITGLFANPFARLAGIRDTWQRQSPLWEDACHQATVLHFIPNEQWLSMSLREIGLSWLEYAKIGKLLWDKQIASTKRAVEGGYRFTSAKGTKVITFDNVKATSDAAELLGSEVDLVVGFAMFVEPGQPKPKLIFSTRSHANFDCGAFCKSLGGGGHTRAAGFNIEVVVESGGWTPNPYSALMTILETYEAG